jgi:crossover junction endodeoxyribonuclease RuvC
MRFLGIDPGTASVGYGIIDEKDGQVEVVDFGVFRTSPKDGDTALRLQIIYKALNGLLADYQPDVAAVEELFFGKNTTTAIKVGQARGVLLLCLANADVPVAEYSPPKIKEAVTGYGNASKEQIQYMVQNLLNLSEIPKPDDAADGLAIALTHYQHWRTELLYGAD